ncbi:ABC transporter substrate-binding protein [Neoroseomonas soli]|uniref:ABC transporter substrate-binding protein n=1 Tax=Neoroseomonas soli TaxID=1081025 RepID=A0A9X9X101_9PROT|nr:ABC transporter substrate-binding protein [Neoroseomonas soli]MBR0673080.1 ABC transporter substrate-binding protein [Neoroseomonas soli]
MTAIHRRRLLQGVGLALVGLPDCGRAQPAAGRNLRIASVTEAVSLDPHLQYFGPDRKAHRHIFESLCAPDARQHLQPALAQSWHALDDRTWEFRLRPGVRFHDGSPFTAEDAIFSLERAPRVPGGASSLGAFTQSIAALEAPDPLTLRVRTRTVAPLLPNDLSNIFIVSKRRAETATTADFNRGEAVIGTGPYRFVEWRKGFFLHLRGFADHWGGAPPWNEVRMDLIADDAARVQALLSGEADIADQLPPGRIAALQATPSVTVVDCPSNFLLFLNLDQFRQVSPYITSKDGRELPNPLLKREVRRALSMAVDRARLAREVMQGTAEPADQLLPQGFAGRVPGTLAEPHDPAAARALLAAAGYRDGWRMTLHGTSDRYSMDGPLLEAVARDWRAIGLDVSAVSLPSAEFFRRSGTRDTPPEFSVMQVGWGTPSGESSSTLKGVLATQDFARGFGASNRGRYSNPAMDRLLDTALATVDDGRRDALLQDATRLAVGEDRGIIPLIHPRNLWAVRRGIAYVPRADNQTSAMDARPA